MTCCSLAAYSQKGVTFSVEKLSKPESLLPTEPYLDVCVQLILFDVDRNPSPAQKDSIIRHNILARSEAPELVKSGSHPFFNGVYQAYADHRPLVLSPDMIWLLISQGFARHVSADPEKMRSYFVDFQGVKTLTVTATDTVIWENIIPELTNQIGKHTGQELIDLLTADFSTTTSIERIVSQITVMEAMKPYFEYVVFLVVCGIPEITLTGTAEDWQKVLDKTRQLARYDLEWWTQELEPILTQFVKASKGDVNKTFWRNIFKRHTLETYGNPTVIDGWVVAFFPYDRKGIRNNLKQLSGGDDLPEEIVKVDLKLITIDGNTTETTLLELWAGFFGLEQNRDNFALTPKIGWMIRRKDNAALEASQVQHFETQLNKTGGSISIRVNEIPEALFKLDTIGLLDITFTGTIIIPEQLTAVKIGSLTLRGTADYAAKERIRKMFPDSEVNINAFSQSILEDIINDAKTSTMLVVVDGVVSDRNVLNGLHADDIDTFNILNEKQAAEKYGKRYKIGKGGAYEFTLKKK